MYIQFIYKVYIQSIIKSPMIIRRGYGLMRVTHCHTIRSVTLHGPEVQGTSYSLMYSYAVYCARKQAYSPTSADCRDTLPIDCRFVPFFRRRQCFKKITTQRSSWSSDRNWTEFDSQTDSHVLHAVGQKTRSLK